jgi:hypothetical protein
MSGMRLVSASTAGIIDGMAEIGRWRNDSHEGARQVYDMRG